MSVRNEVVIVFTDQEIILTIDEALSLLSDLEHVLLGPSEDESPCLCDDCRAEELKTVQ